MAEERFEAHPTGEAEHTERSLALMLKSQYTSREFNDVFAATQLREREIVTLSTLFMTRFINLVLSTTEHDLEVAKDPTERQLIAERLAIKKRILSDVCAMEFVKEDSFLYAFALLRQSLKRQSRKEGVMISTAGVRQAYQREEIGLAESIKAKLGLGRYKPVYVEK